MHSLCVCNVAYCLTVNVCSKLTASKCVCSLVLSLLFALQSMMSILLHFAVLTASTMAKFQVNTGADTTCAVYNEEAKCWGQNTQGQLGLGDAVDRFGPEESPLDLGTDRLGNVFVPDSVGCGLRHCCALSTGQQLKCWGYYANAGLDLARGHDFGDFSSWTGSTMYYGDEEGEMDLLMPFAHISNVVDLAVLFSRTFVVEDHEGKREMVSLGEDITVAGIPLQLDLEEEIPDVNSWGDIKLGGGAYTLCTFDPTTADTLTC